MIDKDSNIDKKEVYDSAADAPVPRPIAPRECACGCKNMFYPKRKDQIYLNRQHANFGYNHGKRKKRSRNRSKEERILAKNDEILHRHYTCEKDMEIVERYYDVLKADGFKFGYNIGRTEKNDVVYNYTYRYYYSVSNEEPKQVKIYKR